LALWRELRSIVLDLKSETPEESSKLKLDSVMEQLFELEKYWGFPGRQYMRIIKKRVKHKEYKALSSDVAFCLRAFTSATYRKNNNFSLDHSKKVTLAQSALSMNYFEVLFVDDINEKDQDQVHDVLNEHCEDQKDTFYRTIFASSYEGALTSILFNPLVQSVVIRYQVSKRKQNDINHQAYDCFLDAISGDTIHTNEKNNLAVLLAKKIKELRPEVSIYFVTDISLKDTPEDVLKTFNRIFYRMEDLQELHISLVQDIRQRFQTPFFTALKEYSQKPTGVFHAMPISRGNSVFKSWWMKDFGEFYGRNLFLAETSTTGGGLDSLSQPTGPLKKAQEMAADAYRAMKTFFVTNGTSTSNKIIHQALTQPGDIVLIDRECHKSHHYALVLSGATPVYLDSYKIQPFSIYGAVPIKTILDKLNDLKKAGRLDKVKMLVLTNSTFDGIVYNPQMMMEEVLKIKPDMIFLWDEAWFAFASFSPYLRSRTAMYAAKKIQEKRDNSLKFKTDNGVSQETRVRVYATQSTHKTLSSFRQGSVIHVFDEFFEKRTENAFHEAYLTHISTSPNYQILASLDAGRRQAEFEGFELTERSIEMAMNLRYQITTHPLLSKYFHVLTINEIIPDEFRKLPEPDFLNKDLGWERQGDSWKTDEFALDPTKVTLCVGKTGIDGTTFRNQYLMDEFGIQVNKTSPNTVLFMTNIGTTRSSVSYLLSVLIKIAEKIERDSKSANKEVQRATEKKAFQLMNEAAPLPSFTGFHDSFREIPGVAGGNMRDAYYFAYDEENCKYLFIEDVTEALNNGDQIVSANFVTPYPPGFPVLVPGQVVSHDIIEFLLGLDVTEIHGYVPGVGLRLFNEKVLNRHHIPTAFGRSAQKSNSPPD
jgi:arginine decarboxylase